MLRTSSLVLVLSMISSSAFAFESNREDVAAARANGEQLSAANVMWLKSKVILAEVIRANLVAVQKPMNMIGIEHHNSPVSFVLGAGQASAVALAGIAAVRTLEAKRFGELDRLVSVQYDTVTKQTLWIAKEKAQAELLRASDRSKVQIVPSAELVNLDKSIAARETELSEAKIAIAKQTDNVKWFKKLGRPSRIGLGAIIVPLAIVETGANFVAVATVEQGDQVIQDLTNFIDDARATLEAQ